MKKATTYLLLVVFSVNIFGAGTGEIVHWLSHTLEGTSLHWHTHHHDAAHHHDERHHTGHHHTHSGAITFLLGTFNAFDKEASAQCLLHLNWLMLGLTGLLSAVHYPVGAGMELSISGVGPLLPYQSIHLPIPSPPPRPLG